MHYSKNSFSAPEITLSTLQCTSQAHHSESDIMNQGSLNVREQLRYDY